MSKTLDKRIIGKTINLLTFLCSFLCYQVTGRTSRRLVVIDTPIHDSCSAAQRLTSKSSEGQATALI